MFNCIKAITCVLLWSCVIQPHLNKKSCVPVTKLRKLCINYEKIRNITQWTIGKPHVYVPEPHIPWLDSIGMTLDFNDCKNITGKVSIHHRSSKWYHKISIYLMRSLYKLIPGYSRHTTLYYYIKIMGSTLCLTASMKPF